MADVISEVENTQVLEKDSGIGYTLPLKVPLLISTSWFEALILITFKVNERSIDHG